MKGPFKLPSKEEQEAEKKKRAALKDVKGWVEEYIPKAYLADRSCVVDVSEVQCGDPECAPIDTVVKLIFENSCGCVFGIPCEAWEVQQEDVEELMPPKEMFEDWKKGNDVKWPPEPELPEPGEHPDIELRFPIGAAVECCIARGPNGWAAGVVVAHWYRTPSWPTGQYAPYQIKLTEQDNLIFAPQDKDNCIRAATGSSADGPGADENEYEPEDIEGEDDEEEEDEEEDEEDKAA
eukprot:CAMPEP_0197613444 /NCGR_PEP_ID=MMETSP1326-20131121/59021_1 /TAXON_ID=1155430 /ORGANISM="Genus nov. species nov., Strain RCC2288" /LENGTH=235 /DNA_ID=CAMNT_0043182307 /DNA_START=1642 /DNA_END=2349 /DNA_ORIENTATION=-